MVNLQTINRQIILNLHCVPESLSNQIGIYAIKHRVRDRAPSNFFMNALRLRHGITLRKERLCLTEFCTTSRC